MNKKKIKKFFKILFVPISMLICLSIFLINSFASSGFVVDNNGNLNSLNLFSYFDSWSNNATDNRDFFNLTITFNDYNYVAGYSSYNSTGKKSLTFTTPSSLSNMQIYHSGASSNLYILLTSDLSLLQANTTYTLSFNLLGYNPSVLQGLSFDEIMLNIGSTALDYFPFGNYFESQNFNFMDYLIGDNYFTNGRATIIQTNNNQYANRPVPTNVVAYSTIGSNTINQYVNGNILNLSSLSYDLINSIKSSSSYNFNNFTYIDLLPCLNIPTSSVTYEAIQAKYVNLTIYCPNALFTCDVILGDTLLSDSTLVHFEQVGQYINISFDSTDSRYVNGIFIVLARSGSDFIVPNNITSNTVQTISWDLYQMGFDDGVDSQKETYNVLNSKYNQLEENYRILVSSNNVLKQQIVQLQNSLSNNFGFDDVFFAMADTPFKTVSNMLGFELFGVNLFNALIGFITVLACIWLLKKFL